MMALMKNGALASLAGSATVRTAFCGPCFGAGDVPANGSLSIRHTTRNFPSREGSKPGSGQIAGVALMDARTIAATTRNGGILTPATDIDYDPTIPPYEFDDSSYRSRVYSGYGKGNYDELLRLGPNIKDWPAIQRLPENLLLKISSYITDPVTTTDELIPSGETSSYRSNPLGLAEFTLSRKDPECGPRQSGSGRGRLPVLPVRAMRICWSASIRCPAAVSLTGNSWALPQHLRGEARRRFCPSAGCQLPARAGCRRKYCGGICHQAVSPQPINWGMLPFQLAGPTPFGLGRLRAGSQCAGSSGW